VSHDVSLISTIAVGLALAFAGGFAAVRLRLPPIVGYLLAGVVIGPFTPGFVADAKLAPQLAEIGVMLLMFGVGMHFSIRDLLAVHRIAVPGAVGQIAVATLLGIGIAWLWGWSLGSGLVFGLALSVASTVVLLRTLEERGLLALDAARIAVGWLLVEDLLTVVVLVALPALAPALGGNGETASGNLVLPLALTLAKVAGFVAVMLIVGARFLPWLLDQVARAGSRELFTLAVSAAALGIAFAAAELFGSAALGAFLAGIVVSESDHSHRAAEQAKPLEDTFAVLFFLSVGMLFDPAILIRHPFQVLAALAIVMLGKSLAAFAIVRGAGHPMSSALTVAAGLAQIGEFSFILADLGSAHGLLSAEGRNLILAAALFSITLNPTAFGVGAALNRRFGRDQPA
jgi:monovalent cation:H+ antiporter-2, CPA2 family